jgi:putative heme-binding domain-containing protein
VPNGFDQWKRWLGEKDPAALAEIVRPDSWERTDWPNRLRRIDPALGDPLRGREVFEKRSCAGCHAGARAVGPDLAGIGKRFSREDLYRAIVDPDRDVSDRYRGTRFEMADGRLWEGIVIYEAVDGAIIQQANLETIRIDPSKVDRRESLRHSLMPKGLLDQATDLELTDLETYLRSL